MTDKDDLDRDPSWGSHHALRHLERLVGHVLAHQHELDRRTREILARVKQLQAADEEAITFDLTALPPTERG